MLPDRQAAHLTGGLFLRIFTYRNRGRLKKAAIIVLLCLLALLILLICWMQYLQRYLVYTEDGVQLQFPGETPTVQTDNNTLSGEFVTGDPVAPPSIPVSGETEKTLLPLSGVYLSYEMLQSMDQVTAAVEALEDGSAVMLDLKSIYGSYYYTSSLEGASAPQDWDTQAVDALITELRRKSCYLIARLPAFSDNAFALAHQSEGLPLSNGALWMDAEGSYWLNPASETVQTHLKDLCSELQRKGFREIVCYNFYFPESANISYSSDLSRREVATAAAQSLLDAFSSSSLVISLDITDCLDNYPQVTEGVRRYLFSEDGGSVTSLASSYAADLASPEAQLVFCTASRDTRFEDYSLLRPLLEETAD